MSTNENNKKTTGEQTGLVSDEPLHIQLFGDFKISQGNQNLIARLPIDEAGLIALLAREAGRPMQRLTLLKKLDPNSVSKRDPTHYVREALTKVRRKFGTFLIEDNNNSTVALRVSPENVDAAKFDRLLLLGNNAAVMQAAALYRPILEAYNAEWLEEMRAEDKRKLAKALRHVVVRSKKDSDSDTLLEALRLLVLIVPEDEATSNEFLKALIDSGNLAAAYMENQNLTTRCRKIVPDWSPSQETLELRKRIGVELRKRRDEEASAGIAEKPGLRFALPLNRLIGRQSDLDTITEKFSSEKVVTLVGPGGVGKSRLAVEFGHRFCSKIADGGWFVDLHAINDDTSVIPKLADVLRATDQTANAVRDDLETIRNFLLTREGLIIIDNCENLIPEVLRIVQKIIEDCTSIRILVASREPLGIDAEYLHKVTPLNFPPEETVWNTDDQVRELQSQYQSVALFVDRASRVSGNDFALTEANASKVAALCRRFDGLPFAIELIASWMEDFPIDTLVSRLGNPRHSLRRAKANAKYRWQSVSEMINASYDHLLNDTAREMLCHLSLFPSGLSLDLVESFSQKADLASQNQSLHWLSFLQRKSLLLRSDSGHQPRFRLLQLVQDYCLEKLQAANQRIKLERTAATFLAEQAESWDANLFGEQHQMALVNFSSELDNFRAILHWGLRSPDKGGTYEDIVIGLRVIVAVQSFLTLRGHLTEGRQWFDRYLTAGLYHSPSEHALYGQALQNAGLVYYEAQDYPAAFALFEKALEVRREIGDMKKIAGSLGSLSATSTKLKNNEKARFFRAESNDILRELGDTVGLFKSMQNDAALEMLEGDVETAVKMWQALEEQIKTLDNPQLRAQISHNTGSAYIQIGRLKDADRLKKDSLRHSQQSGSVGDMAATVGDIALIALIEKRFSVAARLYGITYSLREQLSLPGDIDLQKSIQEVQDALGEAEFQTAYIDGYMMSFDKAIEFLLSEDEQ